MKILILAVHFEVTGARYIADAFTRLGHNVKHAGPQARLKDAWGVDVPEKYIWKPDVFDTNWKPELVIIADTISGAIEFYPFYDNVPFVVWSNDNHVRNMRHVPAKHYFVAHYHGPAQPVNHNDETWLPCAADLTVFKPSTIPWDEREYDVCCVGVMYPRRVAIIDKMRAAGLKVFAATGLVYEECAAAYQNARISLCVSAAGDVAQRIFETAACGCVVLTDLTYDLSTGAQVEKTNQALGLSGFAVYQNDNDAVTMALDLLGESKQLAMGGAKTLQDIVLTGHYCKTTPNGIERVRSGTWANHSWDARAQIVVNWVMKEYGFEVASRTEALKMIKNAREYGI